MPTVRKLQTAFVLLLLLVGASAFLALAWTARATDPTPAPGLQPAAAIQAQSEVRDFFTVKTAVEIVPGAVADREDPKEPGQLVSVTTIKLASGTVAPTNRGVKVGDVILRAILQNRGDSPIQMKYAESGRFFTLNPGETVIIAAESACSVECRQDFFACCNVTDNRAKCVCAPNDEELTCAAGGPLASACSIKTER